MFQEQDYDFGQYRDEAFADLKEAVEGGLALSVESAATQT